MRRVYIKSLHLARRGHCERSAAIHAIRIPTQSMCIGKRQPLQVSRGIVYTFSTVGISSRLALASLVFFTNTLYNWEFCFERVIMSEKYEVSKKEFLQFQIGKLEAKMAELDASVEKIKQKKQALKDEIQGIKEANRDVFPARGRKKKAE